MADYRSVQILTFDAPVVYFQRRLSIANAILLHGQKKEKAATNKDYFLPTIAHASLTSSSAQPENGSSSKRNFTPKLSQNRT